MGNTQINELISVIIPVYNAEKYLNGCVKSICGQSYGNLEIILVDDGSTDESYALMQRLSENDKRIKICRHETNKGLFTARLTGVKASHGEYLAFVDSDDEISIDWLRLLLVKAKEKEADITCGQFLLKYANGCKEYLNMDPLRRETVLENDKVFSAFMEQEGNCYSWHLVWNKLYLRSLWEDAMADLTEFSLKAPHVTMCEDMAFSTALWIRAKKFANITQGAYYLYSQHSEQNTKNHSDKKAEWKNFENVGSAFSFMREQMEKFGLFALNSQHFYAWKKYYAAMWYKTLNISFCGNLGEDKVKEVLDIEKNISISEYDDSYDFFYSIKTPCSEENIEKEERIKKKICSSDIKVVSFDIFDTLILRPFWYPTDLFNLMSDGFNKLHEINSYANFDLIRIEAEKRCRDRIAKEHIGYEEVTLDEIYGEMAEDYTFDPEKLKETEQMEKTLELRFCTRRNTGKELYDLAVQQGKTVICCSDIYLPRDIIEKILCKNGYTFDKIFISSELRLGKWTGNLFRHIQNELDGIKPAQILHIGDNFNSDIKNAQDIGWNAFQLPSPVEIMRSTEEYAKITSYDGKMRDGLNAELGFIGYRCAMALVANKFFDNPYGMNACNADFDADPYKLGYFAVGQYLYAIVEWIIENIKENNAKKIHFVARDGYLPMKAYEIFKQYNKNLPDDNYLFVSRKSLALMDIYKPNDLYSLYLKLNTSNYTPYKLEKLFGAYYKDGASSLIEVFDGNEALFKKRFSDVEQYERTLKILAYKIDYKKLQEQKKDLYGYFSEQIGKGDLMFDIGYSGRGESALVKILGFPINSLYVHSNSQILGDRERTDGFKTKCFYDYKPCITGVIREHVFMKLAPSTVGYKKIDGKIQPEFEKYITNIPAEINTAAVQNAALDFVRDMLSTFDGFFDKLIYRKEDLAYSFESYLHFSKEPDRNIFGCISFEDEFGLGKSINALKQWNIELENFGLNRRYKKVNEENVFCGLPEEKKLKFALMNSTKMQKALCYFILDKKLFFEKTIEKCFARKKQKNKS